MGTVMSKGLVYFIPRFQCSGDRRYPLKPLADFDKLLRKY